MYEWAADGGKFAAVVLTFIVVGLSWLVAWRLRTLLAPPGPPTTPTELGRSWAGWVVFASSVSELSKSFGTFDIFPFVLWLLGASAIAPLAFALGWGYGKWFKFSNQPTPFPNATRSNEPVVAGESITTSDHTPDAESTWLSGEQVALCEAFIGKKGLSYYLPQFEKFAQQEPKLTPAFNVFPVYKYTAKFFKPNWNWSSFFFVYGWALYRKLYGWSIALFLTSVFCFMAIKEGAAGLGFISLIAAYVAFGMYANAIYYSKAKKLVMAAARTTSSQTQGRLEISDKGGVDPWASWVAAGHVLVGIPAILVVLLATPQQAPITGNSPGQVSLPSSNELMDAPEMAEAQPAAPVEHLQKAPVLKTGWAPVFYGSDRTVYVDVGSEKLNGGLVTIKVLIDHNVVQKEVGDIYLSSVGHQQIDCENHAARQVFHALYSGHMGGGDTIWAGSLERTFQPIAPGSIGEAIFISACRP